MTDQLTPEEREAALDEMLAELRRCAGLREVQGNVEAINKHIAATVQLRADHQRAVGECERLRKERDSLWQLLDDIDTLDDSCREDDRAFRDRTRLAQQKRLAILVSIDSFTLSRSKEGSR